MEEYLIVVYKDQEAKDVKEMEISDLDEVMDYIQAHREEKASEGGLFQIYHLTAFLDYK